MANGIIAIRPKNNSPQLAAEYWTSYNGSGSYTVTITLRESNYYSSGAYFGYRISCSVNGINRQLKAASPSTWKNGVYSSTWYNVPRGTATVWSSSVAMAGTVGIGYDGFPAPTSSAVATRSVGRTSAVVYASSYNLNGLGVTGGGWDYGLNTSTWSYSEGTPLGDKTLGSLTPNTRYYYRNYIVTAGGAVNSPWNSFTTTGNAPTASSLSVSNIARTSASLSISASYDTNASLNATEYSYGTASGSYPTSTGASMTGLRPNTTYYVRGRVKDNWGRWSGYATNSFTTTGNAPTITYTSIGNITSTSAQLSWGYSFDTNASFASMTLQYGTTTNYGTNIGNTNMTGLRSNTTYYYRVRVTDNYGRSSAWSTGSFRTDYPTQQITSLLGEEATEDSLTVSVNVANPSWLTNVTCWLYEEDGTTLVTTQTKTSNIAAKNNFLFENLNAGTEYVIKARITTRAQTSGGYNSNIVSLIMATVDATPVSIVRSDGTIEKHKMYVMGRGNIYNPSRMTWQNGYYSTGTTGIDISTLLTQSTSIDGGAASTQSFIEILPNIPYTIKNNEEDINFIIHGTDNNNIVTTVGYQLHAGQTYEYTGTNTTTRLWISIASDNNPMINYATAPYYKMNIFRTVEKTLIPKDNIVKISDKIRYIDIIQAGSSVNTGSHIVALKVFDLNGNDIALNKTVTMIKGLSASNLDRITNGNTSTDNYADITPKNTNDLETIIRVDLGQEYDNIDYVQLWRYYADGRTYHNTKLYGRRDSKGAKEICWKFQSYKIEGTYAETANGYKSHIIRERVVGIPIITSVLLTPNNSTPTINGTKITINADWTASIPPVLDSYISYRTDAILAANQGRIMKEEIGSLSNLSTTAKTNLVAAINEIWDSYSGSDIYNNVLNSLLNAILNK